MLYLLKQTRQSISTDDVVEHWRLISKPHTSGEFEFVSITRGFEFGQSLSKVAGLKASGLSRSVPEGLSISLMCSSLSSSLFTSAAFSVRGPALLISAAPSAVGAGLSFSACGTPGAVDPFSLFSLSVDFSMEINLGAVCLPLAEGFAEFLAPFMSCFIPVVCVID